MKNWYADGLRFSCIGCHYCCGVEPGYVFLTKEDLCALSSFFSLSKQDFITTYCTRVSMGSISYVSLQEKKNCDCVFLTAEGCSVYESRPIQCATYPFWESIVADRSSWIAEGSSCPGIGKGRLYRQDEIISLLSARVGVEPVVWEDVFRS